MDLHDKLHLPPKGKSFYQRREHRNKSCQHCFQTNATVTPTPWAHSTISQPGFFQSVGTSKPSDPISSHCQEAALPKAAASSVGLGMNPRFTPASPSSSQAEQPSTSQCNVLPMRTWQRQNPKALINHSPAPGTISNFYYLKNGTCSAEQSMVHLVL